MTALNSSLTRFSYLLLRSRIVVLRPGIAYVAASLYPPSTSPKEMSELPSDAVLALVVDPSEEATRLRQATSFAGILSRAEREAIARKIPSIN